MMSDPATAVEALNRRYLLDYPLEAARKIESMEAEYAAGLLAAHPVHVIIPVWEHLPTGVEESILVHLPDDILRGLLTELEPARSASLLSRLEEPVRDRALALLETQIAAEIRRIMEYPADSAGRLMDARVLSFHGEATAQEALRRLREARVRGIKELFLIDDEERLSGRIEMHDLALAAPEDLLRKLARPLIATVQDTAPREEVVEKLEQYKMSVLPVVDFSGRLAGVIRQAGLVTALQEEASLDIQTMVGASRDERALSRIPFAVKKRLPWLEVNLLTAFLAASVVGLFESTIAKFTALAVLLPVVAGQSGNAGAQALAVTMRGLALREIGLRHWPRVVFKEINVGLLNGIAIAITTAVAVFIWSRSTGLAMVIGASMVLSMVAAGFSGALIPITLTRLGQDPAQSSSIILTTVTDVVGFFSFLGIATMLSGLL